MNFLAHLWLAEQARLPLAGAILGDVLRGPMPETMPPDLAQSVQLHRRLDAATDRHPRVQAARSAFAPGERRYAGIVLDLLYDHVLAQDWPRYSAEPIGDFARRAAGDVAAAGAWFERAEHAAPRAEPFAELLLSYASPAGFELAARRTAARLSRPQGMLEAMRHWPTHLPRVREGLPDLLADLARLPQHGEWTRKTPAD
jgi:acyl carrier protein phosphodiesterase